MVPYFQNDYNHSCAQLEAYLISSNIMFSFDDMKKLWNNQTTHQLQKLRQWVQSIPSRSLSCYQNPQASQMRQEMTTSNKCNENFAGTGFDVLNENYAGG